ncbi:hypothetical protein ACFSJU_12020 [Paradesertivirga mongoliensis]|uniref:Uncharacterized protein n=1 Tax=Paradesertivirga mongoliensis TaxID=2100740 RepID=A0ABW4ZNC2_9SPHI|nr:hypothetical protein [Pedobacter mongoliensis]
MPTKSDSGHAKNVANFEDLLTRVRSLGTDYNPSKAGLSLTNLELQHQAAAATLKSLAAELPLYQQAVDAKQAAFAPLGKLVTRALNMFKASVDNKAEVESATSLANKIRGVSSPKPAAPAEGEEPVRKISTSQLSADMQLANLASLIEVLSAHASYQPNEAELSVAGLMALHSDLSKKAQDVTEAQVRVETARLNRDKMLYTPGSGIVDLGIGVKTYVKAAFTPKSVNYKPILSLDFRRGK